MFLSWSRSAKSMANREIAIVLKHLHLHDISDDSSAGQCEKSWFLWRISARNQVLFEDILVVGKLDQLTDAYWRSNKQIAVDCSSLGIWRKETSASYYMQPLQHIPAYDTLNYGCPLSSDSWTINFDWNQSSQKESPVMVYQPECQWGTAWRTDGALFGLIFLPFTISSTSSIWRSEDSGGWFLRAEYYVTRFWW